MRGDEKRIKENRRRADKESKVESSRVVALREELKLKRFYQQTVSRTSIMNSCDKWFAATESKLLWYLLSPVAFKASMGVAHRTVL